MPTDQLKTALGHFAPHASSSDHNQQVATAMATELGKRKKGASTLASDMGLVSR